MFDAPAGATTGTASSTAGVSRPTRSTTFFHGRKSTRPKRVVKVVSRHPASRHARLHRAKVEHLLRRHKLRKARAQVKASKHRLARYLRKPRKTKVSKG